MTKEFIISEIKRIAEQNAGKVLGRQRFYQETGIKESDWHGKFWTKWSDVVKEAGLEPNTLNSALPSEYLLKKLSEIVEELNRFPTSADMRIKARNNPDFPSHNTFNRFGNKSGLAEALKNFCEQNGKIELIQYCLPYLKEDGVLRGSNERIDENGSVYLYKSSKHYKIGRTNDLKRRDREIKLQLPLEADLIHRIITDDPVGIEKYWHNRFADKRLNGEWFNLSASDIKAFRRRKFM